VNPRVATGTPPARADEGDAARPRVLVVDDEPVNRTLLRAILRKDGCEVLEADGGERALALAGAVVPDLVLLDIMMPTVDGYRVCARLKADARTAHVPVVFLSALSDVEDKLRGFELGAADFVTKPFDRSEVVARVRNLLALQRLTRTLAARNEELVAKQRSLDEDLEAAAQIQASLLPSTPPADPRFALGWRFLPCDRVGGDLVNVVRLDEHRYGLFVFDVSGHGVPAAMVAVSVARSLTPGAGTALEPGAGLGAGDGAVVPPADVLRRLDREYPIERFGRFFTICYAVLDARTGEVAYGNAGHPWPIVVRRSGRVAMLDLAGTIIGLDGELPHETGAVVLEPGDRLFLYSDGVTEREGPGAGPFGAGRLTDVLRAAAGSSVDEACEAVVAALARWAGGAAPSDDVTILGLERRP